MNLPHAMGKKSEKTVRLEDIDLHPPPLEGLYDSLYMLVYKACAVEFFYDITSSDLGVDTELYPAYLNTPANFIFTFLYIHPLLDEHQ